MGEAPVPRERHIVAPCGTLYDMNTWKVTMSSSNCPQCDRQPALADSQQSRVCPGCTKAQGTAADVNGGHPKPARRSTNSVALGVLCLVGVVLPPVGIIVAVTGLVLAYNEFRTGRRTLAKFGIMLCGLGLLLSIINVATHSGITCMLLPGQ